MAIIRRTEQRPTRATFDPFEMMRDMLRMEPYGELSGWAGEGGLSFAPQFEVKESKDAFEFKADLPGVKEEDLDISLAGNRLTISGTREAEKKDEGDTYYAYERSYGSFSRSFTLPPEADLDQVNASLEKGVLNVHLPKRKESHARKIQVQGEKAGGKGAKA